MYNIYSVINGNQQSLYLNTIQTTTMKDFFMTSDFWYLMCENDPQIILESNISCIES